MIPPVSLTLHLSGGSVVLRAWGSHVVDARLTDLLRLTETLSAMREQWPEYTRQDVDADVWAAFWRLVHSSLDGAALPARLSFQDRLSLLDALWTLNDMDAAEGKLKALGERAARLRHRLAQGPTTPTTNISSAHSA